VARLVHGGLPQAHQSRLDPPVSIKSTSESAVRA
jgi:hypothetical protein